MQPEQERATTIGPGVTLFTKDGSNTGNAIIINQTEPSSEAMADWMKANNETLWLVETDFGNKVKLTTSEINAGYWLGYQKSYDSWFKDRMKCINGVHVKEPNT